MRAYTSRDRDYWLTQWKESGETGIPHPQILTGRFWNRLAEQIISSLAGLEEAQLTLADVDAGHFDSPEYVQALLRVMDPALMQLDHYLLQASRSIMDLERAGLIWAQEAEKLRFKWLHLNRLADNYHTYADNIAMAAALLKSSRTREG